MWKERTFLYYGMMEEPVSHEHKLKKCLCDVKNFSFLSRSNDAWN